MLGMTVDEFEDITLGQFFNKNAGFMEFQRQLQMQEWKRMNYIVYNILLQNPNIKQHAKPKTFEAFLKAGEENKPKVIKTKAELMAFGIIEGPGLKR